MHWRIVSLFWASLAVTSCLAEKCIPSDVEGYASCSCTLDESKRVFNLSPLSNPLKIPRFTTVHPVKDPTWNYSFNPCHGFNLFVGENSTASKSCKNVATARWIHGSADRCEDLGDQKDVGFEYSPTGISNSNLTSNLSLTFTAFNDTLTKNQAVVYLVCNANMTLNESTFNLLSWKFNPDHSTYFFSLESKCGCPDLCGAPKNKTPAKSKETDDNKWLIIGVSIGAIVLLLLVILALICCKQQRKAGYTSV